MDKLRLIELMEGEAAKLSPEGRELWEEWEFMVQAAPDLETKMSREYEIVEQIFELPASEQIATTRLVEMLRGLRASEAAENQGAPGEKHRVQVVINAAILKDQEEGRTADPSLTLDQALARLEERG